MANPRMSDALVAETLALVKKHGGVSATAKATGLNRNTLVSRYNIAKHATPAPTRAPVDPMVREPLASFEEAWSQWQRTVGMMRDRYKGPPKQGRAKGRQKILVIPDLHAPFHNVEMFATMIAREKDVDKAICIGDLSDSYALSTFTHYRAVGFS
jgi:hypothetical protein